MKVISGIYKVTSPSGNVYIGQSWDIYKRWKGYHYVSRTQKALLHSFEKYGVDNHLFEICCELPLDCSQETMNEYEILYWKLYRDCGVTMLNIREPGSYGKHSEETKQKMKGRAYHGKNNGKVRSIENRKRISDSLKARTDNKGILHKMAKLTEAQVLEIREKYIPGLYGCKRLAKEYNMSKTNILDILHRKIWRNI